MRPSTSTGSEKFDLKKTLFWDAVSSKTGQNDTKQQQRAYLRLTCGKNEMKKHC